MMNLPAGRQVKNREQGIKNEEKENPRPRTVAGRKVKSVGDRLNSVDRGNSFSNGWFCELHAILLHAQLREFAELDPGPSRTMLFG